MDPTELPDAILGGKTSMEGILGEPISYLAYPGGFNDMLVQYVTKQSGYKMAFTVQPGTVKPGDNLYALNRLAVFQGDTPYLSFWLRLHCAPLIKYTWALRDTLRDNGWPILASIMPLFLGGIMSYEVVARPLRVAVLTASDTRTLENDKGETRFKNFGKSKSYCSRSQNCN